MTPYGEYRIDLRQYLLGNVSEDIQRQVEILLLTEKSVLEEVQLLEDELIDDYVSGDLPDQDRSNFEQNFLLTPERHQKLRASVALTHYASSKSAAPARGPSLGERIRAFWNSYRMQLAVPSGAALLVVVFLAGGQFPPDNRSSFDTFAIVNLTPSASERGGPETVNKAPLPVNVDGLKISLELPAGMTPSGRYRVELESRDGKIRSFDQVGQDTQSIFVIVPAEVLSRGQYALKVYAIRNETEQGIIGNYFLDIE